MYALISAIERDLRDIVSENIAPCVTMASLFPKGIADKAADRFGKENPEIAPDVDDLLAFLDLGDVISTLRYQERWLDQAIATILKRFYVTLEALIPVRNRVMHSRPLEFDDLAAACDLSEKLERSHRSLWAELRSTLRLLEKNPDFVTELTIPESIDESISILHNLPQVEFDDTGFLGRVKELGDLKKALFGSYPVVTVVGEGGLGKTALALKACYDLLDSDLTTLDAIVWTTAKATRLTANEIHSIDGAITSSLGIIESANIVLGRQTGTQALDDLLLHLENNRILLVIDNLETVVDQTITDLVRRLPAGSRIMFTTRISLGAFDFPIPLFAYNKKEAATYFRSAARAWGVSDLSSASQPIVEGYCERLQNNPLSIKCFMQSVQAGHRPSKISNDPHVFLQFCLQNVFGKLSANAKTIAAALSGLSGPQSIASLAFYSDLDSIDVQSALSLLITSNLVSSERGRSSEDEDRFMLSALARLYIQKIARPSIPEQKKLIAKQNQLRSAAEEYSARVGSDLFDINHVSVRDKDDYIVARILTRAIDYVFRKAIDLAEKEIERAMDLSPNYFEVHRVLALVRIGQDDFFGAETAYEAAISLAPDRAPLRLWYGGFLSRNLGDTERACEQLFIAEKLAPHVPIVKLEYARLLQYQRQFDDAGKRLSEIVELDKLSSRTRRVHLDLCLQNEVRRADFHCTNERWLSALQSLEKAHALFTRAANGLVDARTVMSVSRAIRSLPPLYRAFKGLDDFARVEAIANWLGGLQRREDSLDGFQSAEEGIDPQKWLAGQQEKGHLVNLCDKFGFIQFGVERVFFHRSSWTGTSDYGAHLDRQLVDFEIGSNHKGLCATNVRLTSEVGFAPGQICLGTIKSIQNTFGFIELDGGREIFFHRSDCASKFKSLFVGERVKCRWGRTEDGKVRAEDVSAYSGTVTTE